ncbi:hypothetical protein G7Y89_g8643 [Cudoniella acicularis]|uniref:AMP-dependent synthetase/ligase domain-containing protein n=1 Tax=Cudoniella acicularis TaxID=354080 RepID=A0A8H4W0W5_9HELO|nr:hypothetical protein G7Y89_g8643 [Cudoniella acicularis]
MGPSMPSLLHQALEEQAIKTPGNVAIEYYPDVQMTYSELNDSSNRLARYLKNRQPEGREIVALCLEMGPFLVIAILAVLKAGMAWVPLPQDAPRARISHILKACNIELAFCSESTKHIVGDMVSCFKLDEIFRTLEFQSCSSSNLGCNRNPSDLCHILFTSGSTGVPKGVLIEHLAVAHNVRELVKEFGLGPETRTLQFAAPTFDVFSLDLFMTILCGGCLIMAPLSSMVADLTTFIRRAKITYAQLTPTILEMIDPPGVSSLQVFTSSGEALSQKLANRWRNKVRLFNAYGPTETIVCTTQELGGNQIDAACIGQELPGLEVCLLAHGSVEEVPEGEIGEICVAGPQLFRGYISTEKSKDTKSIECNRNGKRHYRTGDLGKIERGPAGEKTIRYLGRRDGQVKLHGIRVDLGDVEQSILTCHTIQKCAIVLPRSGPSGGRLCSIVVLHQSFKAQGTNLASPEPKIARFQVGLLNGLQEVLLLL